MGNVPSSTSMKTVGWRLLLSLGYLVNLLPRPENHQYDCPSILYSPLMGGLDPSFPGVVAHGVHSITIPDIKHYFPSSIQNTIRIPVVNPDLISQDLLLPSSPEFQSSFHSPTLQAVDRILSHLGEPHYDIRGYTDLERLVHAAHMHEMWYGASKVYSDIQERGGITEPGLCQCIQDVENKDVIRMLHIIARKARKDKHGKVSTPGNDNDMKNKDLVSNLFKYHSDKTPENDNDKENVNLVSNFLKYDFDKTKEGNDKKNEDLVSNLFKYHFDKTPGNDNDKENTNLVSKFLKYDFDKTKNGKDDKKEEDLVSNLFKKYDVDKTEDNEKVPHLQSPENWETWKLSMKTMEPLMEKYNKYLAIYMYCMLN